MRFLDFSMKNIVIEGDNLKKLQEVNKEDYLVIEPIGRDSILMDKEEFMQSHWYLDKEPVKVFLAEDTYATFDLYYALESLEDDMHEDWLSNVMDAIPDEVRERIEKEINGYLAKEPTYYPGEKIEWL